MKSWIVAYLATAVAFVGLDFLWLGFVARTFYRDQLGSLMLEQPRLPPAAAFYVLYVFGIVFFAVSPSVAAGGWTRALSTGALFGLVAYATYDLSNLATLKGWPIAMTALDIAWGAALTGVAATVGVLVTRAVVGVE